MNNKHIVLLKKYSKELVCIMLASTLLTINV